STGWGRDDREHAHLGKPASPAHLPPSPTQGRPARRPLGMRTRKHLGLRTGDQPLLLDRDTSRTTAVQVPASKTRYRPLEGEPMTPAIFFLLLLPPIIATVAIVASIRRSINSISRDAQAIIRNNAETRTNYARARMENR